MTSRTIHHINISDLTTLRLTCVKCQVVTVVNAKTWDPKKTIGAVICAHCTHPWGNALLILQEALRAIDRGENGVTIQVELVE